MNWRTYQSEDDVQKMRDLLMAGRAANNGTYYMHTGDLDWALYRPPEEQKRRDGIRLYEVDEQLLAWVYAPPQDGILDFYVHPSLHRSAQAEAILDQAIDWSVEQARSHQQEKLEKDWVADSDEWLRGYLERHGFASANLDGVHFTRDLATVPDTQPPMGYSIASVTSESIGVQRAQATYRAFRNTTPWPEYLDRYQRFFASPAHVGERDLVIISPDGFGVSACCIWFDMTNKVGLFEPVGTHPDFQRKGLGKALMSEALRRMKTAGLTSAMVSTNDTNSNGIALYQSMGFTIDMRLSLFEKKLV